MAQATSPPKDRRPTRPGRGDDSTLLSFLRYTHIFSQAVQEVLETKFLADAIPQSLTVPQFHLLKLIALNGNYQVGEVAGFLGVSSPAASKNIDKLERMGLVRRMTSPDDRRATLLSANSKGREMVRRYEDLKSQRLAPILQKFPPEELQQFTRHLERFSVLLYSQERTDESFCLRCAAYTDNRCPLGKILGNCTYEKIRSRGRSAGEPAQEDS
jgi:DNA-binding MarR family transcriptional regulator